MWPSMRHLQVAIYGMNPKIGLLSFPPEENQLHKPYRWGAVWLLGGAVHGAVPCCHAPCIAVPLQWSVQNVGRGQLVSQLHSCLQR